MTDADATDPRALLAAAADAAHRVGDHDTERWFRDNAAALCDGHGCCGDPGVLDHAHTYLKEHP